jgi:perosamine synthetase
VHARLRQPRSVPVSGPWITEKEVAYVAEAAANAWYENANLYQERFERAFAAYTGRGHAIALPSCTSALHLALAGLGLGPGDEVIVPEITWIATAAPISYVGATPVFADVDPDSWCLSAEAFERCLTARTKAAIVVDLYGGMPAWDALSEIAERRGVALLEDAAEAVGSGYRGRRAGAFGVASAFSFHGSKTLTTGEGGMLLTDAAELRDRCLLLRDHGRQPGDRLFRNSEVAFKYRMSGLQAALGLAQLERVEELVARKREIFGWYRRALADCDWLTLNAEPDGVRNSYWMVTALLDPGLGIAKEALLAALRELGVDGRPFFYPLSALPAYAGTDAAAAARERNRVAYALSPRGVNLPSGLNMTPELVDLVAERLRAVVSRLAER